MCTQFVFPHYFDELQYKINYLESMTFMNLLTVHFSFFLSVLKRIFFIPFTGLSYYCEMEISVVASLEDAVTLFLFLTHG